MTDLHWDLIELDMVAWDKGRIDIHEIERRLEGHGLSEDEIMQLLPNLVVMKGLDEGGVK